MGALGGIATTVGAYEQSKADNENADNNQKAIAANNALLWQHYQETRGLGGNAILPMYMPTGTEQMLGEKALAASQAINAKPAAQQIAEYQASVNGQMPTIQAGNQTIADIYNGNMLAQRQGYLDPVNAARVNQAQAQADAVNVALAQQLNAQKAAEQARGFSGGSSFADARALASMIGAQQAAAQAKGTATYQNAQASQAVYEDQLAKQLASLDMPALRAQQLIALNQAPYASYANLAQLSQAPLQFFKLPVGNAPQSTPEVRAYTTDPSAAVWTGVGSTLSSAGGMLGGMGGGSGGSSGGSIGNVAGQMSPSQRNAMIGGY